MLVLFLTAGEERKEGVSSLQPFTDDSFKKLVASAKTLRAAGLIPKYCYSGGKKSGDNFSEDHDRFKRRWQTAKTVTGHMPEGTTQTQYFPTSELDHIYSKVLDECRIQAPNLSPYHCLLFVDHRAKINNFIRDVAKKNHQSLNPLNSEHCALYATVFDQETQTFYLPQPALLGFTQHHHDPDSAIAQLKTTFLVSQLSPSV